MNLFNVYKRYTILLLSSPCALLFPIPQCHQTDDKFFTGMFMFKSEKNKLSLIRGWGKMRWG